jgi:hypothetical protein
MKSLLLGWRFEFAGCDKSLEPFAQEPQTDEDFD